MEKILKDMEQRIKALKGLESLMKGMTETISKFKSELSKMEFDVNSAKLDSWTRNIFNYLIDIAREDGLTFSENGGTVAPRTYIDMDEIKKGLKDRGVKVASEKSEPIIKKFLNEMISLGLDFITSKEMARDKYRKIEKEFRKKIENLKKK
ncbi:MAG: hypothetical protein GF329_12685 [Candidatus Lokiarchaeota archaeon]|nr:hypothetical protein [Candidatus Lokiarchaeota archaeon]